MVLPNHWFELVVYGTEDDRVSLSWRIWQHAVPTSDRDPRRLSSMHQNFFFPFPGHSNPASRAKPPVLPAQIGDLARGTSQGGVGLWAGCP